jgi:hypothetical protein
VDPRDALDAMMKRKIPIIAPAKNQTPRKIQNSIYEYIN